MGNTEKKLVRADLVQRLEDKGFSRRLAVELVNLVFAEMIQALARGETVEFPLGHLERVKRKRRPQRGWFLDRITTIYQNPWTVRYVSDEGGQEEEDSP
jgi:nucleoid DNA-binding protein